ncbi:hypothetical protein N9917_01200 [Deltaproteobacteria bacterium]|nr:hypothetical protein [Deltaproteobacteria bacterium]
MSNSDFIEFGFDDNDSSFKKSASRFKAKEGETYRMSVVWWPEADGKINLDAKSPRFVGAKRAYIAGVGYVLANNAEVAKLAGKPAKPAIATIMAVWPTNNAGSLDKARFVAGDVAVMPWIFSQDRYEVVKRRHEEFPLGAHDITFACTDTQYQKGDISPCRESLYRKVLEEPKLKAIADFIAGEVSRIADNIHGEVARDMTLAQIREALGGEASGPVSAGASEDVDGLLDDLGV